MANKKRSPMQMAQSGLELQRPDDLPTRHPYGRRPKSQEWYDAQAASSSDIRRPKGYPNKALDERNEDDQYK